MVNWRVDEMRRQQEADRQARMRPGQNVVRLRLGIWRFVLLTNLVVHIIKESPMFRKLLPLVSLLGFAAVTPAFAAGDSVAGAVYAMSNASAGNQVLVYDRSADGFLSLANTYPTGGLGSGGQPPLDPADALGSQGSLVLSGDGRWLFAANAGSNEISVFRANRSQLVLTDKVSSGGLFPSSVAQHKNLVYVLNAGGDGNITGFTFDRNGRLRPMPGSTRALGAGGTNPPFFLFSPAQVGFTPRGDKLVVVIKGMFTPQPTHRILVYDIDDNGLPGADPVTTLSPTTLSFGFVFDGRDRLIVAEPFGSSGAPGPGRGAMSSYEINGDGTLTSTTVSEPNFQTATCWAAITGNGHFVYATNNGSGTISGYRIAQDGTLQPLDAHGITASTDVAPVDLAITRNGRFLYNVNAGSGTISMFRINEPDGSLTSLGSVPGLPIDDGAAGIAAR